MTGGRHTSLGRGTDWGNEGTDGVLRSLYYEALTLTASVPVLVEWVLGLFILVALFTFLGTAALEFFFFCGRVFTNI
jgi:hypothetical protein